MERADVMRFWATLFGSGDEQYQPTLTDEELMAIQELEEARKNGIADEDWYEYQSQYSDLVARGVFLEQVGDNEEWRWNKENPVTRYGDEEPEPRKKFLGLF